MFKLVSLISGLALASTLSAQVEPRAGQWKTWVIASGSALRLPAPPDVAGTAAEIQWVKSCVSARTQANLAQVRFWDAGAPGYRWMQLTEQLAVSKGLATPLQTRALSLVAAAIYDATIAAWDSKYAYNRQHPADIGSGISTAVTASASPSYPSEHAVTAAAAADVLAYLFPDQTAAVDGMADQAGWSRIIAGVAFPSDVIAGMDLGHQVAQAVIAYANADGSNQAFAGSFAASPGVWSSPTPVAPLAGTWHPWVLTAPNQFRPAAPPVFGSSDANAQYVADKNLQRTNTTNHLAWFWQPGFSSHGCGRWRLKSSRTIRTPTRPGRHAHTPWKRSHSTTPHWPAGIRSIRSWSCGPLRLTARSFQCSRFRNIPAILRGMPALRARQPR